jgi:hypothetical protein
MPVIKRRYYTLFAATGTNDPADSTTFFFGFPFTRIEDNAGGVSRIYIPVQGIITACEVGTLHTNICTNEAVAYYIRLNDTTDYLIQNVGYTTTANSASRHSNYAMNIPVNIGDYIEIKTVNPAWVTNPLGVRKTATILVSY